MTPEEREAFYDREIAPTLLELARRCEENEISLVCQANWGTSDASRTTTIAKDAWISVRMTEVCARASGNIDAFMMAMMKHANEHGHQSIVLMKLGVPEKP